MHNLFDLTGKRTFITGSAREIGYLLANGRGRYGASVIVMVTTSANTEHWGEPQELIGATVFLSFPATDFVNGHLLFVNGGIATVV